MAARIRPSAALILIFAVACGEPAPPTPPGDEPSPAPGEVELLCDTDGTAVLSSTVVAARTDGVHLVVDNRYDEPVSVAGFDADPGVTRWTFGYPPGPLEVMCWPFSDHPDGEPPERLSIQVVDPDGLYVWPPELACETDEQWVSVNDFFDTSSGVDADPVEAARVSLSGIEPGDVLAVRDSGYPDADDASTAVVVSREGRIIAIVGLSLAEDGAWYSGSARGCADAGVG